MNDEKRPTEYDSFGTYQTGSTEPPKSHGGAIAFLLGLVIFLCSIITAMGLMNIKLTRQLQDQSETELCSVAFSRGTEVQTTDTQQNSLLGFSGQAVPIFWQTYHDLPQGIYITQVDDRGAAAAQGLCAGDILLRMDGIQIPDWQTFSDRLAERAPGDSISITVYRAGTYRQCRLTLTKNQE